MGGGGEGVVQNFLRGFGLGFYRADFTVQGVASISAFGFRDLGF